MKTNLDSLIVKTFINEGFNGDRASHTSSYKDYKIILDRDGEQVELVHIHGYDHYWTHIKNPTIVLQELGDELAKFEKIFGVKATGITLVKKITEEWVEDPQD